MNVKEWLAAVLRRGLLAKIPVRTEVKSGLFGITLGVLLFASRPDRGIAIVGAFALIFFLNGVAQLVIGLVLTVTRRGETNESEDDGQEDDVQEEPETEPQFVGKECICCREKILSVFEGTNCKSCHQPMHQSCMQQHRNMAHRRKKRNRKPGAPS